MVCVSNFSRVSWRQKDLNFAGLKFINFYLLVIYILGSYVRNHCLIQIITMQKLHFFSMSFSPFDSNWILPAPWLTTSRSPAHPLPYPWIPPDNEVLVFLGTSLKSVEHGVSVKWEREHVGLICVLAPEGPHFLEPGKATPWLTQEQMQCSAAPYPSADQSVENIALAPLAPCVTPLWPSSHSHWGARSLSISLPGSGLDPTPSDNKPLLSSLQTPVPI